MVDLMEHFNVSNSTIIKALESLEIKGMIYQRRGSEAFVRAPKIPSYINLVHQSGTDKEKQDFTISQNVIGVTMIQAVEEISHNLLIDEGNSVFRVKRVSSINRQNSVYETSYYNASVVPYLDDEVAQQSIFEYLKSKLKFKFAFTDTL